MVFARAAALPKGLGRAVLRRAGATTRNRSWRQVSRRGYASDHGHGQQQSSEIPWIIGSLAVTIPAASYLISQGPTKSDHGHGHDSHDEKHEEQEEEQPQEEEESKEESKDEGQDDSDDKAQDENKDEGKGQVDESDNPAKDKSDLQKESADQDESEDSDEAESKKKDDSEDEYEAPGPNAPKQINWDSSKSKGPGEGQKGERKPTEKKGEKDSQGDHSGAKHPYLDDPEKSKKGVGVTETAKIHGTVDPSQGARGVKSSGEDSS